MSVLTLDQMHAIFPHTPTGRLALFVDPLNAVFEEFSVRGTPEFLGQFGEETDGFTKLSEELHYKDPARVERLFHRAMSGLSLNDVRGYIETPELFASKIYANRNGNGPEATGDGWRFRGGGIPQLTFHANYEAAGRALGLDLVGNPDLVRTDIGVACRVGGWFWQHIGGNGLVGNFTLLTERINGGTNGLDARLAIRNVAGRVLAA